MVDARQSIATGLPNNDRFIQASGFPEIMEWDKALATGVAVLDDQHQALFRCFNQLEAATADKRVLLTVFAIDQLKIYARDHFAEEERLMRLYAYPPDKLRLHIGEHAKFIAKLHDLMMVYVHHDISSDMLDFLREWLLNHTSKTDLDYVAYMACAKPPAVDRESENPGAPDNR